MKTNEQIQIKCYHCGDVCSHIFEVDSKFFCCNGCVNVYQLLNRNNLDEYYCLNENPGQKVEGVTKEKYAFLEEESILDKLLLFRNKEQAQVSFYLPQMHCSSCLWLLEHLNEVNPYIITTQVNFSQKTLRVVFKIEEFSLRKLAELLAYLGYAPVIEIEKENSSSSATTYNSKKSYLKLGITGFAFGNSMMLAFPDYLGLDALVQPTLATAFSIANVALSIPVVFYGAQEFFVNAWYSFRQRYLNIDAPIALAIAVTYLRSLYEVFTQTGNGFFDSMSGIVFFMLLARTIQNRSYSTLKFNRDYQSYFPIAVSRWKDGKKALVKLENIEENDVLLIHHQEVIPTDCLLSKGEGRIDYSFITGEDKAEIIDKASIIYAGGRNIGNTIEVVALKSFQQNSFTQLWNNQAFKKKENDKESSVTILSKYFSIVVLLLAFGIFSFWFFQGASTLAWQSATAVLIIACPCALLLTANFTNGYVLEKLAHRGLFLKNAQVIEKLSKIDSIAFDKTGTLTESGRNDVKVVFTSLTASEIQIVHEITSQSLHPLSRAISAFIESKTVTLINQNFSMKEIPGKGLEAWVDDQHIKIGSSRLVGVENQPDETAVYVSIDNVIRAKFTFDTALLSGIEKVIQSLSKTYDLSLISGDNSLSKKQMAILFNDESKLYYRMSPEDKLNFVKEKQNLGHHVMMIGDGLNDAGALQQSDVGVSVVKSAFAFSPACDVIMDVDQLKKLPTFLKYAKKTQQLIAIGFMYSVIFNLIGLAFAFTGNLTPLAAAIIMPSSSLGIILIAFLGARRMMK